MLSVEDSLLLQIKKNHTKHQIFVIEFVRHHGHTRSYCLAGLWPGGGGGGGYSDILTHTYARAIFGGSKF